MNYYYLAASLPALSFEGPAPLSYASFRDLCSELLSRRDLRGLSDLGKGPDAPSRHPFVREWNDCEIQLRNALVHHRAARRHLEAEPYYRPQLGYEPSIEKMASEAFSKPDPLQRERALDRFRWALVEKLAGLNMFASRAVLAYAVKLRIAERWSTMEENEGAARARDIVARPPSASEREQE